MGSDGVLDGAAIAPATSQRRQCAGWPTGHNCPVIVRFARRYCQGCEVERALAMQRGMPETLTPVGIVVEDIEAETLVCRCGGDPCAPRHVVSLDHLTWSYATRLQGGSLKH